MDTFKSILFISVCGLVSRTFAKNVRPTLRHTLKRLDDLERKTHMQNIDTELKFEDVLQAISILNTSHWDVSAAGGVDSHLGVDGAFNDELDIKHARNAVQAVLSHLKRGFKEEKSVRKQAIASMKQDMETVENYLRTAIRTELVKVNDAIGADRNVTMDIAIKKLQYQTDKLSQVIGCKYDEADAPREWNGHWYIRVKTKASFDRATVACGGECNAHLVDIQSAEEHNFVSSLANYGFSWIGLTDVREDGVWRWHHNNETALYFHWRTDEPNSYLGEEEHCVTIDHTSGWNDDSCGTAHSFICKL